MAKKTKRTTWVFDIDATKFKKKAKEMRAGINKIGDPKNLDGLKSGLIQVTAGSVAFVAALKTMKATMDLAFRADRIKEINNQFERLTANAGIAGDEMKSAAESAAGGLLSTNELLELANQNILSMGKSAGKTFPQLVTLADKVSKVMGGDLKQRLGELNKALNTASAGAFEQLGILIDEKKALEAYAKQMGITVDVISRAGKRQAILNAVLKDGGKQFKDVDTTLGKNADSWVSLKNALVDFGDTFALVFEKTIGPGLQRYFNSLKGWSKFFRDKFVAATDKGLDGQKIRVQELTDKWQKMGHEINQLAVKDLGFFESQASRDRELWKLKGKRAAVHHEMVKAQEKLNKLIAAQPKPPEGAGDDEGGGVDVAKATARKAKFEAELLALKQQRVSQEIRLNMDLETADQLHNEQRALIQQEFQTKLDDLEAKEAERLITKDERLKLEAELYAQRTNALIESERNLENVQNQALDNWLNNATTAADGFEAAITKASRNAAAEQKKFGVQATFAVNTFHGHATKAFLALGEGSKNLGDAMKSFVLGALADIAENHGKMYLLQGFTNPALFGAGAALIALAGFLRSMSGGGGGSSGGGGGGAIGGGAPISEPGGGDFTEVTPTAEEPEKKKVEINFHGDYLDTAETQQRFVDIIREAGDVQEFNINKID